MRDATRLPASVGALAAVLILASGCGDPASKTVACTADADCLAGEQCADGVCKKVLESCVSQPAGTPCTDDGNPCTRDACDGNGACAHPAGAAGAACGDDGDPCTLDTCDSAGGCAHPPAPSGTSCADDGSACTQDVCDGQGECVHPSACAGYGCDAGGTCKTRCDAPADCAGGLLCREDHTCEPPRSNGSACTAGAECASGFCPGGFCCNTACEGSCQTCGASGVCTPEPATKECRPTTGQCDPAEFCNAGICPPDAKMPDGSACGYGTCAACTGGVCGQYQAACQGNCSTCNGSGVSWNCEQDSAKCSGDCAVCSGGATSWSCVANDAACQTCFNCTGANTAFSCTATPEGGHDGRTCTMPEQGCTSGGRCRKVLNAVCAANDECISNQCECETITNGTCQARRCAPVDCVCKRYDAASQACSSAYTNGWRDEVDCSSGDVKCWDGACSGRGSCRCDSLPSCSPHGEYLGCVVNSPAAPTANSCGAGFSPVCGPAASACCITSSGESWTCTPGYQQGGDSGAWCGSYLSVGDVTCGCDG